MKKAENLPIKSKVITVKTPSTVIVMINDEFQVVFSDENLLSEFPWLFIQESPSQMISLVALYHDFFRNYFNYGHQGIKQKTILHPDKSIFSKEYCLVEIQKTNIPYQGNLYLVKLCKRMNYQNFSDDLQNKSFLITDIAIQLNSISNQKDIMNFILNRLEILLPEVIILYTQYSQTGDKINISQIRGISEQAQKLMTDHLAFSLENHVLDTPPYYKDFMHNSYLIKMDEGLLSLLRIMSREKDYDFFQKLFRIYDVYRIGLSNYYENYGALVFCTTKVNQNIPASLIESIAHQAFLSISNFNALNQIRESEEKYKAFFNNNHAVMLILDPENGKIIDANASALKYYGWSYSEITNMKIMDINTLTEEEIQYEMEKAKKEEKNYFCFKHRNAHNQIRDVEVYSGPVFHEKKGYLYSIIHDITEKIHNQNRMIEHANFIESLIFTIPIPVYYKNTQGVYQGCNFHFAALFNKRPQEIIGKTCSDLFSETMAQEICLADEELIRDHFSKTLYWDICSEHDEETRHFKVCRAAYKNAFGRTSGILGVCIDITENIKIENEYKKAKEIAEKTSLLKDEFIANISHEIRTPLNIIQGISELLNQNVTSDTEEYLSTLKIASKNMCEIINTIFDLNKLEKGIENLENSDFDLFELLSDIFRVFLQPAEDKDLRFYLHVDHSLPQFIHQDKIKIKQIITNFVNNALKYTTKGEISIQASMQNHIIKIGVRDTGIGIKKEYHHFIFDRFTQIDSSTKRKISGLGLGLNIVKKLCSLIGAEITMKSEYQKGSLFEISFPYTKPLQNQLFISDLASCKMNFDIKALIVEDNPLNTFILKKFLSQFGIQTFDSSNGYSALELLASQEVDIIFMDLHMPDIDGYDAIKAIRTMSDRLKKLPIIAVTADVLTSDRHRCEQEGFSGYIPKPVTKEMLYHYLSEYFPD